MADIVKNPKARRDYHILETFEAGIVLRGTEVKSLRAGKGQIAEAFARLENNEVWLHNAHIDEYTHGNLQNHLPKTPRKLLLKKGVVPSTPYLTISDTPSGRVLKELEIEPHPFQLRFAKHMTSCFDLPNPDFHSPIQFG